MKKKNKLGKNKRRTIQYSLWQDLLYKYKIPNNLECEVPKPQLLWVPVLQKVSIEKIQLQNFIKQDLINGQFR